LKLEICGKTASEIADLVRDCICEYMADQTIRICGLNEHGVPKVVEIDESLFLRKYNRGRIRNGQWHIGGIKKVPKNFLFCL